jgi:hypothetical protein
MNEDSLSLTNRPLAVGDLEWKDFPAISFTHHSEIIDEEI